MGRKVSLVLGSGGARGITQIGVIKYLVEQGYEIDEVVGCSIGSLVGAAFAEGKINNLGDWMCKLTKKEVFRLLDFTNSKFGFLKGERVLLNLQEVFEDISIEDLSIKYTAVATDLFNESEIIFREGSVYEAIRASISIPGVFTGVERENKFLVDGGVLNPVPVNLVQNKENIIIAVNLDGPLDLESKVSYQKLSAIGILQESYMVMRRKLAQMSLELYPPDYTIHIPNNISGIWDFYKSTDLIEKGYEIAKKTLNVAELTKMESKTTKVC